MIVDLILLVCQCGIGKKIAAGGILIENRHWRLYGIGIEQQLFVELSTHILLHLCGPFDL